MKIKLCWETEFATQEEYDTFLQGINAIHLDRYGFTADCVYHALTRCKEYKGAINTITVTEVE